MKEPKLGFIATTLGVEQFDGKTGKKIGEIELDVLILTCVACSEKLGPGSRAEMRLAASEHYMTKHGGTSEHGFMEIPIPEKPIEEGA